MEVCTRVSQTSEDQRFGLDACMAGKVGVWSKMLSLRELMITLGDPDVVVSDRADVVVSGRARCRGV